MDGDQNLQDVLRRLRAGDPAAAVELCRRYGPHLRVVVRRRLDPRLRPRFDSLDFTQEVWASFFALAPDRYAFDSPAALVGFLARMAHNKVVEEVRRQTRTRKHDITREVPLDHCGWGCEVALDRPSDSPSEQAVAAEQWEQLLDGVPPAHRVVVEQLREGYTYEEIGRRTGISTRSVKRIVRRLKEVAGLAEPRPRSEGDHGS